MPTERTRTPAMRAPAWRARAVLLAGTTLAVWGLPAAADDTTPSPLQARLDALQRIEVTEARAPGSDAAPVTPDVRQVLDEAEAAEREEPGSAPAATTDD